jgi:hypothetical protein
MLGFRNGIWGAGRHVPIGHSLFVVFCGTAGGDDSGEKYLRYVPNTDHSLKGWYEDAAEGALAFYQSI